MSNTKKTGGLGAESYFQNIPTLNDEKDTTETKPPAIDLLGTTTAESSKENRKKVRRTYALYEDTQIALEELKLNARKQGDNVTLGDLLEEAVQLLIEKKRVET